MTKSWALRKGDYAGTRERRRAFRAFLAEQGRIDRLATHELVFGELVTNAVRYGDEPMWVSVVVDGNALRIQTENRGECFDLDHRLKEEPTSTSGRGLRIVRALADKLTVDLIPAGCRVTAMLPL